ncbi:hypothetical protein SH580_16525 [Coraliomargarita algicola]|uniref:Fimbrial assembly family protein n=1 Tax=Coraliomargarita algicola TaxID=3092156 RepID=A0ABZ0RJ86_9BACT|nr:hypothetical protein [Coraliomargarita sp. J2-16]WPJ95035.1 hypothetical protein SH580_16525 [Coraliomargarita sp. J2-16]
MQPFWRPNFVNQSELPDIKVIRTGFIINFVAVTLALCVAFFLLQREYRAYSLGNTVAQMEQQIRVADADDRENLKLSESFRTSAQYIVEVEQFFDSPLLAHEFLYGLSVIKPDDLIFSTVSLTESIVKVDSQNVVAYNIVISGNAKNLTVLDDFKNILEEAELLEIPGFDLGIDETLQGRDEKTGIFPYRIAISLKPAKKAAPAKKEGGDAS